LIPSILSRIPVVRFPFEPDLAAAGISSGPSGAASLAGARAALTGQDSADRRTAVGVNSDSVIVLLSTEADSAG